MPKSTSRNKDARYDPPAYDFNATMRWLKLIKSDFWWRTQMPFNELRLCDLLGTSDRYVKLILARPETHPPEKTIDRIGRLIDDIEERKIAFPPRCGVGYRKDCAPKFLHLEPKGKPLIQKICDESAWSLWARCSTCGGNKFLPISCDGRSRVACYNCFPPSQYPQIGARGVKKSLIHEALKIYY